MSNPWWVVYKVEGGGIAQELVASYVQSAVKPKTQGTSPGQIESVAGPYPTRADAVSGENQGTTTLGPNPNQTGPPNSGTGSLLGGIIPTDRALWTRIAEGTLGVALILVGVAKLAEGTPTAAMIRKVPIF